MHEIQKRKKYNFANYASVLLIKIMTLGGISGL